MARPQDSFLILDFGSQYTQLIARRIRELQVYSEIHPYHYDLSEIKAWNPKGIILSGGPASVLSPKAYTVDPKLFELGIPILGICYGMQLMCHMLGGEVEKADKREFGKAQIEILEDSDLFFGLQNPQALTVWMSHGDRIKKLPPNFIP
ncbi:MAG: glutamine-hydrolyzing GMP synthase, partial [Deltaproteobacteria bacterium]|nr:glutamine-hydrolyzing GMP synthase [Deltaproteobacteria bacterium]